MRGQYCSEGEAEYVRCRTLVRILLRVLAAFGPGVISGNQLSQAIHVLTQECSELIVNLA
jgi:hypothetical protein